MRNDGRIRIIRFLPILDFGGVESRVVLWSQLIDRERYDARVCCLALPGRAAARIRALGLPVDCLEVSPKVRDPRTTLALARYLRRTKPDILHASVSEGVWHGSLAAFAARVPRVIVEETGIPVVSRFGALAYHAALRTVDTAIGVSEATCDYWREVVRVDPRKVHHVTNCAAPRFFEPLERVPGGPGLRVLTIGRLHPIKNLDGLLHAFREVLAEAPDTHLTIAGDGPEQAALEALRASLDLEKNVSLHGFEGDVRALHAAADLFLLPSHSEGQSIALIEAMASGLPVRASRRGGTPEVVAGLGAHVLFDPLEEGAIARAVLDFARLSPAERAREAALTQQRAVEVFSPTRYMRDLDRHYRGESAS